MIDLELEVAGPLDLVATLRPLVRGRADPTIRLARNDAWRATRTPDGPATLHLVVTGSRLRAEAWGPGAERALAGAAGLAGLLDDRTGFRPEAVPLVARLDRQLAGHRIGRSGAVLEALVPAILEQKVTGREASRAFLALVRAHGEPAPGSGGRPGPAMPVGLRLPPPPDVLAALPYYAFHPFGVERRRAELISRVAGRAARLEALADRPPAEAQAALRTIPGVGPWTAAEVAIRALGDADAVSVGDFHTKHLVAWTLAGEPRGTDERMLELLEPFTGHRGRVVRLLEASGLTPPRYGPRLAPRSIAEI